MRVIVGGEVNRIPEHRNCALEVTRLPEALETNDQGVTQVAQMAGLVRVIMKGVVNSIPVPRNCLLEVTELIAAFGRSIEGAAEVAKMVFCIFYPVSGFCG